MKNKIKNSLKIIFLSLIIMSVICSEVPFVGVANASTLTIGDGIKIKTDSEGRYQIGTPEELYALAKYINSSTGIVEMSIILTDDIDFKGTGIKTTLSIGKKFKGTFDGNGHYIAGLYSSTANYSIPTRNCISMFTELTDSVIKNLTIKDGNYYGHPYGGLFADRATNSTIENCIASIKYDSSGTNSPLGISGIVSYAQNCKIINCKNEQMLSGDMAKGIVGEAVDSEIIGCVNYGPIISDGYSTKEVYGAGIIGYSKNSVIKNCINYGKMTAYASAHNGGIVAVLQEDSIVENCYTIGDSSTGGIVYKYEGGIIKNCFVYGSFYIVYDGIKESNQDKFVNNYVLNHNSVYWEGKYASQFKSGEVCWLLNSGVTNGTQAYYQNLSGDAWDEIPVFDKEHGTVYRYYDADEDDYYYSNVGIVLQPKDSIVELNENAVFEIETTGVVSGYQWQVSTDNGQTWKDSGLKGNKTNKLSLTATEMRNNYMFRCAMVDELNQSIISDEVKLTVNLPAIIIKNQPQSKSVKMNENTYFTISAVSTKKDDITYQWQTSTDNGRTWKNSSLSGNKTKKLTVNATAKRNNYMFRCVVKDTEGNMIISDVAKLEVIFDSIIIEKQPTNISAQIDSVIMFDIAAKSNLGSNLTYQWQTSTDGGKTWKNSGLTGNKTKKLSVQATSKRDGYQFRCIVKDTENNTVTSDVAVLTVK